MFEPIGRGALFMFSNFSNNAKTTSIAAGTSLAIGLFLYGISVADSPHKRVNELTNELKEIKQERGRLEQRVIYVETLLNDMSRKIDDYKAAQKAVVNSAPPPPAEASHLPSEVTPLTAEGDTSSTQRSPQEAPQGAQQESKSNGPLGFKFGEPLSATPHPRERGNSKCLLPSEIYGKYIVNALKYGGANFDAFDVKLNDTHIIVCAGEVDGKTSYIFVSGDQIEKIAPNIADYMNSKFGAPKASTATITGAESSALFLQWSSAEYNVDLVLKNPAIAILSGDHRYYVEERAQRNASHLIYYTDDAMKHFIGIVERKHKDRQDKITAEDAEKQRKATDNASKF